MVAFGTGGLPAGWPGSVVAEEWPAGDRFPPGHEGDNSKKHCACAARRSLGVRCDDSSGPTVVLDAQPDGGPHGRPLNPAYDVAAAEQPGRATPPDAPRVDLF